MRQRFSSSQIIVYGFMALIILGTMLLMLPISTKSGESANFMEALFTATSSVCVTGLIIQDTATYWSVFGQVIIILLIQIGGMGVITVAVALAILSGKKITLKQRSTMQEAISAHQVGGIVKFTGFILKTTALIELIGALLLFLVFFHDFGFIQGLSFAIFHSISAFCNAGFDLMGVNSPFSSLTGYANQPMIIIIITSLIIIGGVGFMTWEDIKTHHFQFKKFRMQSKVVLCTTIALIIFPTVYFYCFEYAHLPFFERLLTSYFQAVTPRTAGFNTADLTQLSETGLGLMIVLMLVGGSPGSTAGGLKTTTFAVLISTAMSVFSHREQTHFFKRRISDETIKNATTIFVMYLILFFVSGCAISRIENLPLLTCLFEAASAIGTVGLTLGITPQLSTISHLILIALMFFGRVGGLTLIFATFHKKNYTSKYPQEKITVG